MAKRFEGKRVFITGASSGIGAAVARRLALEGARVALAARREDRLEEIKNEIRAQGGTAIAVVCDVTDRSTLDQAVAKTVKAFGGIDLAFANAGFGVVGKFESLDTDAFRRQFETNFFGVLNTIYAVLPHLIESKGHLGVVSSVLGRVGTTENAPYCASKFAVCGLAEVLYHDLGRLGVSVTCIEPGITESEIRKVDNRGVYHPRAKDPAPHFLIVPTERAARAIVNALHRRKFEAVITAHGKIAVWLGRHMPGFVRFLGRVTARRHSRRRLRPKKPAK